MNERQSLEAELAGVEARLGTAIRSTKRVVSALGAASKASNHGDLAALHRALKDVTDALATAKVDLGTATSSWSWDEEMEQDYLQSGAFTEELKQAASAARLELQEDEGQLMCYPSTLRIDVARRVVLIDKKPYKFLRPAVLVAHLRAVQQRPARFKAAVFIESLHTAWEYARHYSGDKAHGLPGQVRVDRIYAALTIAPGSSKEYTKQEFGRDLYLLEDSGVTTTKKGSQLKFSRSTGTKASTGVITVVGEDGRQVLYSTLEFTEAV
ncbi:MAG: hypothetical protein U1F44_02855 [Coriobacteriia bacterium]|nr:hypothetical protein [Coriobacteriia bacterium]